MVTGHEPPEGCEIKTALAAWDIMLRSGDGRRQPYVWLMGKVSAVDDGVTLARENFRDGSNHPRRACACFSCCMRARVCAFMLFHRCRRGTAWFRIMRNHEYEDRRDRERARQLHAWRISPNGSRRRFQAEAPDGHCGPRSVLRQVLLSLMANSQKASAEQIQSMRDGIAHTLRTRNMDVMRMCGAGVLAEDYGRLSATWQAEKDIMLEHADDLQNVDCTKVRPRAPSVNSVPTAH